MLDISGQVFGKLTAIRPVEVRGTNTSWLCKCSCGVMTTVKLKYLPRSDGRSTTGNLTIDACDACRKSKACKECGNNFVSHYPKQYYCSPQCSKAARLRKTNEARRATYAISQEYREKVSQDGKKRYRNLSDEEMKKWRMEAAERRRIRRRSQSALDGAKERQKTKLQSFMNALQAAQIEMIRLSEDKSS